VKEYDWQDSNGSESVDFGAIPGTAPRDCAVAVAGGFHLINAASGMYGGAAS
jgi:hypothetical protein